MPLQKKMSTLKKRFVSFTNHFKRPTDTTNATSSEEDKKMVAGDDKNVSPSSSSSSSSSLSSVHQNNHHNDNNSPKLTATPRKSIREQSTSSQKLDSFEFVSKLKGDNSILNSILMSFLNLITWIQRKL